MSWMTVFHWEHETRVILEDKLASLAEIYGKPLRWLLTVEGIGFMPPEVEALAQRIFGRISEAPLSAPPPPIVE